MPMYGVGKLPFVGAPKGWPNVFCNCCGVSNEQRSEGRFAPAAVAFKGSGKKAAVSTTGMPQRIRRGRMSVLPKIGLARTPAGTGNLDRHQSFSPESRLFVS